MQLTREIESYRKAVLNMRPTDFEELAMRAFFIQSKHNEIFKLYLSCLKKTPQSIKEPSQIPFLPIEFFKTQNVMTGSFTPKLTFLSSGTSKQERSKHFLSEGDFYQEISISIFEKFYGKLSDFRLIALLPSYMEQGNSSLVFMAESFMLHSRKNSFFSLDFDEVGRELDLDSRNTIVFGVSYALMDFAEKYKAKDAICIETGGMKGRRKERTKEELHEILRPAFREVHSEYGMTELLSQAYAKNSVLFTPADTMRVFLRNLNDPFDISDEHKYGGLNVTDLANIESCCFIETKDIARKTGENFEILGRYDYSDLRGCNLMLA